METITITIPKKMLSNRYRTRRLVLVEPKELTQEAKQRWEMEDAEEASRVARREWKDGKTRQIASLKDLM